MFLFTCSAVALCATCSTAKLSGLSVASGFGRLPDYTCPLFSVSVRKFDPCLLTPFGDCRVVTSASHPVMYLRLLWTWRHSCRTHISLDNKRLTPMQVLVAFAPFSPSGAAWHFGLSHVRATSFLVCAVSPYPFQSIETLTTNCGATSVCWLGSPVSRSVLCPTISDATLFGRSDCSTADSLVSLATIATGNKAAVLHLIVLFFTQVRRAGVSLDFGASLCSRRSRHRGSREGRPSLRGWLTAQTPRNNRGTGQLRVARTDASRRGAMSLECKTDAEPTGGGSRAVQAFVPVPAQCR